MNLADKIKDLKKERNAIILAHIYQRGEIQDIADFVGDSLELSRKASQNDAKVILFCGVHFMAETASILNPNKTVLIPNLNAGCVMADMADAQSLKELKEKYPTATVVAYVNTSAVVKAESDICCTSSNAVNVVKSIKSKQIIFVPDKNLGAYTQKNSGKEMIFWNGFCPIHNNISQQDILKIKEQYPNAEVLVHPECKNEVIKLADKAMSTGAMCKYVHNSKQEEFIIGTEIGILYKLQKENPNKKFYPVSDSMICQNMKRITLENVYEALKENKFEVKVPEEIRKKAYLPIKRMLEINA